MVFCFPDTLQISPISPYNTTALTASVYIGADELNVACNPILGFTRTYIHLLMRNVTNGETWTQAQHVATYDCYAQCCLNTSTVIDPIPGVPGKKGWYITFDQITALPVGTYEFLAVDDADYQKTSYEATRVAKRKVTITQDPSQIIVDGGNGTDTETTECEDGDYICQYKDYLPYVAAGIVVMILILGGSRRR